ncbi:glycoside hydrolase family 31 protein [Desertivirga arenae]|uniref:glycoside hydrolase family 31 protein n=1 Tax=Desertivirga arenae TaxID=2810309 RepID=UPI001A96FF91|nr:TIM-barrel domain-containing protein [Pedobacter sp. SYSU D00823]
MRIFLLLCFFIFLFLPGKSNERFKLSNGNHATLEVCSPSLIHMRIASSDVNDQTLMERYRVLKTNWQKVNYEKHISKEFLTVETSRIVLRMSLIDGAVVLKRKGERENLIDTIRANVRKNDFTQQLEQSLKNYFSNSPLKSDGIIGDAGKKQGSSNQVLAGENSVLSFSLKDQERFYGLGNASRESIQHRGHAIRIWVQYQRSESPIPYVMSNKGWGVFYNTTKLHFFDVGRFNKDKMYVYEPNQTQVDFYLFEGNSMQHLLDQYTDLTGKSYVLPRWAYGLAFGSNTKENQFNVLDNAYRFRQEEIPCDIYWLEPQWMAKYYDFSTKKDWNKDLFVAQLPWTDNRRALFIKRLSNMGFKTALWLCVEHDFSIEEEDRINALHNKPLSGKEHWFDHLKKFVDQGVIGFKLDPSRTLDEHPDTTYHNGRKDAEMHMLNQTLLVRNLQETLLKHTGKRSFQHYCGGYAGVQRYGAMTLGDNGGTAGTMVDLFNLGMSGSSNISCDILDEVDPLLPGMHMGFFLPWVQLNSWAYTVYPFYFSPKDKAAFRFYDQLRYQLNPYIYSNALVAAQTGLPMARPMPLMYPDNEKMADLKKQYMFGENFLIGAFTNSIELPEGRWIDFWTNKAFHGNQSVSVQLPENAGGPLFIKAGAIIPFQNKKQFIETLPPDSLILKVYPYGNSSYTLLEDDGETHGFEDGAIAKTEFSCNEQQRKITFSVNAVVGSYKGMPSQRFYEIQLQYPKKPLSAMINGKKTNNWTYNSKTAVLTCRMSADTRRSYTIDLFY